MIHSEAAYSENSFTSLLEDLLSSRSREPNPYYQSLYREISKKGDRFIFDASTQSLLNPLKVLFGDDLNAMEFHPIGLGTEQAIGHTTVKVDMRVQ
jgi:hypothetical protein